MMGYDRRRFGNGSVITIVRMTSVTTGRVSPPFPLPVPGYHVRNLGMS
jgi:hypothetical protein